MSTTNMQELPRFALELDNTNVPFSQRRAFVEALYTTDRLEGRYIHFKQGPSTPVAGASSLKELMQTRRDETMTVKKFLAGITENHHLRISFANRYREEGDLTIDEINVGVTRTDGDCIEYALLDCPYTEENYATISLLYSSIFNRSLEQ